MLAVTVELPIEPESSPGIANGDLFNNSGFATLNPALRIASFLSGPNGVAVPVAAVARRLAVEVFDLGPGRFSPLLLLAALAEIPSRPMLATPTLAPTIA
jgi:hypothetical protein